MDSSSVSSRFVSQNDVEEARKRRNEQWKAAYARLGQEPPPPPTEEVFDGRSLAEKLAANKAAKQEEWEEKTKLANQFRALEEDEVMFLDSVREREEEAERLRREVETEEVQTFKAAVAARTTAANPPPATSSTAKKASAAPENKSVLPKKAGPKSLKGIVVKKKKLTPASAESSKSTGTKRKANDVDDEKGARERNSSSDGKKLKVSN